jgi:hypothetical protein
MHKCKQHIWDEEGRSLKACCPNSCQSPIQFLATVDSHSKLQSTRMSNKSGLEEESSAILFYLNASITLSKFPIMMQTQIRATNMRWVGTTFKSLQPTLSRTNAQYSYWPQLTLTLCCQAEMWWPLWTGRGIFQEITVQQLTWNWCEISWPASVHQ